jgi:hypothetical protein
VQLAVLLGVGAVGLGIFRGPKAAVLFLLFPAVGLPLGLLAKRYLPPEYVSPNTPEESRAMLRTTLPFALGLSAVVIGSIFGAVAIFGTVPGWMTVALVLVCVAAAGWLEWWHAQRRRRERDGR